jgi:voltage-gated potassium channel
MPSFQLRVMQVLEKSQEGDRVSRQCDLLIVALVTLNVIAVILESIESIYLAYGAWLGRFEIFSIAFFSIEYALRIWSNGARHPDSSFRGRREYVFSFYGLVDLIAILPYFLQVFMPGVDLRILRVFRLLRLLKLSHYSSALEDLFRAMYDERRAFAAVGYILAIVIISTSSLMYFVEREAQPDKLQSIPDAMYWSIISLTTVGYGDVTPVTALGKVISMLTAFMGVATVALFTGIIASSFNKQLVRKKLIYEQELRKAFADGVITEDEEAILAALKTRFELNEELTSALRDSIKTETQGLDSNFKCNS